jgi:hypothetical protein
LRPSRTLLAAHRWQALASVRNRTLGSLTHRHECSGPIFAIVSSSPRHDTMGIETENRPVP